MTSEIKVDTISEQTSANGVTIDGLTIKDGNIQGSPALVGTTPSFTIGDGGAEDTKIVFDGNALDYYIGLDDSADNLIIGSGSTVGSNSLITIDSDGDFTLDATSDIILDSDAANWRFKDGGTSILEIGKPSGAVSFYSAVSDADILFKGNDGGAAITALTIDMSNGGNVGIGTTSIDVSTQAGGSGYRVLQIENAEGGQINLDHNDAGTGSTLGQINFQRAGEVVAEIEGVTDGATDNGKINFRTQPDGGALTVRMTIDHDGNVKITNSANVYLSIDSTQTNGDEWHIFNAVSGTSSTLQFKNVDQSAVVMLLDESGKVGIGNTAPDVLLDVGDSDSGSAGNTGIQIQQSQAFATVYDGTNTNTFAGIQTVNHDDTANRTGTGITFVARSSGSGIASIQSTSAASDRADLRFITRGSGGIGERVIINDDGKVGINNSTPGSYDGGADDLVVGDHSVSSQGITIASDDNSIIYFADGTSGDEAYRGSIIYNHPADNFIFRTGGFNARMTITSSGEISTNGEAAPDVDAGGITLNTGATDGFATTFKNSDVSHGITGVAEADTYGAFVKANSANGGIGIYGFADSGTTAVEMQSYFETNNTSKATNANVPFNFKARLRNGTSSTAPSNGGANANLFGVSDASSIRFIIDSEGDIHVDGSSSISTYDKYEDAHLVRAYDLSHGKGVIDSKFDKFISYNHEKLAEMKLVGREDDGTPNHFINMTGMQRLHNGAIWQQYEKHQKLASAFYKLATKTIGKEEADKLLTEEEIQLLN